MAWVNPEVMLRVMLAEQHGELTDYGVSTPSDLATRLPFHRLTLVRGADDTLTDVTVVDIESFAGSRALAGQEAEAIRTVMLALQGKADAENRWLIDSVTTILRPVWLDYRNPDIHRYVATYQLATRPLMV